MSNEEFQDLIRRRLVAAMENNGARQKIVPIQELETYIAKGWEFVATLPNGKPFLGSLFEPYDCEQSTHQLFYFSLYYRGSGSYSHQPLLTLTKKK